MLGRTEAGLCSRDPKPIEDYALCGPVLQR